jgi:hypothetical protein
MGLLIKFCANRFVEYNEKYDFLELANIGLIQEFFHDKKF